MLCDLGLRMEWEKEHGRQFRHHLAAEQTDVDDLQSVTPPDNEPLYQPPKNDPKPLKNPFSARTGIFAEAAAKAELLPINQAIAAQKTEIYNRTGVSSRGMNKSSSTIGRTTVRDWRAPIPSELRKMSPVLRLNFVPSFSQAERLGTCFFRSYAPSSSQVYDMQSSSHGSETSSSAEAERQRMVLEWATNTTKDQPSGQSNTGTYVASPTGMTAPEASMFSKSRILQSQQANTESLGVSPQRNAARSPAEVHTQSFSKTTRMHTPSPSAPNQLTNHIDYLSSTQRSSHSPPALGMQSSLEAQQNPSNRVPHQLRVEYEPQMVQASRSAISNGHDKQATSAFTAESSLPAHISYHTPVVQSQQQIQGPKPFREQSGSVNGMLSRNTAELSREAPPFTQTQNYRQSQQTQSDLVPHPPNPRAGSEAGPSSYPPSVSTDLRQANGVPHIRPPNISSTIGRDSRVVFQVDRRAFDPIPPSSRPSYWHPESFTRPPRFIGEGLEGTPPRPTKHKDLT